MPLIEAGGGASSQPRRWARRRARRDVRRRPVGCGCCCHSGAIPTGRSPAGRGSSRCSRTAWWTGSAAAGGATSSVSHTSVPALISRRATTGVFTDERLTLTSIQPAGSSRNQDRPDRLRPQQRLNRGYQEILAPARASPNPGRSANFCSGVEPVVETCGWQRDGEADRPERPGPAATEQPLKGHWLPRRRCGWPGPARSAGRSRR